MRDSLSEDVITHAGLVGRSPRLREIARLINKLGNCRWPVLLLGETGTGKEVVARAIHDVRKEGPFVTVDCSAMVAPLMESELFGYAKGAFTGAHQTKAGLLELAHGGTAFFDEIGELPLDLQAKLLRVLQEKQFRPVGSLAQKRIDFRVIAATNRDLRGEVERGAFRRDLYYRLNVVTVRMDPLRERREDIPLLANHFAGKHAQGIRFTDDLMEVLLEYDWPGNVREVEHTVQSMAARSSGPYLHTGDLPSAIQNFLDAKRLYRLSDAARGEPVPEPRTLSSVPMESGPEVILPLAEVERRHILRALEFTRGDRRAAANLLGIGRATLYRRLAEYGITPNRKPVASQPVGQGMARAQGA